MVELAFGPDDTSGIYTISTAPTQVSFQDLWKQLCREVDVELNRSIDLLGPRCPDRLREACRYSLLGPGKRLRPILCLLACEALGGDRHIAMPFAVSLEMIHCYSLIHDDLPAMDDDDLRRGRPTSHIQFDEATAILAGDALQCLAFETVLRAELPPERLVDACQLLSQAAGAEGMVAGQMDDLWAEKHGGDAALLASIHARKTGAMIRASVQLGVVAAGGTAKDQEIMSGYGESIGIAFQIADDLLDVESSVENTGKRTGKDQERGKLTYPAIHGIAASREKAERFVAQAVELLSVYGSKAAPLQQLARYIIDRSH